MQLKVTMQTLAIAYNHTTAFLTVTAQATHCKHPFPCTFMYSAATPEQNSETKRSGRGTVRGQQQWTNLYSRKGKDRTGVRAGGRERRGSVWPVETEQEAQEEHL